MSETLRKVLVGLGLVVILLIAAGAWVLHGNPTDRLPSATVGRTPQLVDPEPEKFPTISIPKPIGWKAGEAPTAANGLVVNRFAEGLDHPRTMLLLPNGDVIGAVVALTFFIASTCVPFRNLLGVAYSPT